jgi:tRNA splicing ligase
MEFPLTEYVRADIAAAATERAVRAALESAAITSENVAKPMTGKVATAVFDYCRKTSAHMIRAIAADPKAVAAIIEGAQDE